MENKFVSVLTKEYTPPPIDRREALRYAGARGADSATEALLEECITEAEGQLRYSCVYCILTKSELSQLLPYGGSELLSSRLAGCEGAMLLCATVGIGLDRLIAKYGSLSPARALMLQALGAERIEALCDLFCRDMGEELSMKGMSLTPRFSPGYGDLPLSAQKEIFAILNCPKMIGLTLNESLIMSPTKSVTAIIGIKNED